MNYLIVEKARSHKYIRRTGMPGKYEYFYQEVKEPEGEYKVRARGKGIRDALAESRREQSEPLLTEEEITKLKEFGFESDAIQFQNPKIGRDSIKINERRQTSVKELAGEYASVIETAPPGIEGIDQSRKEAVQRIKEWRGEAKSRFDWEPQRRQYSDEQILWEGYKWRHWAHRAGGSSAWEWAMWEEIQKLAKQKGFVYTDKLTRQELLDNPMIPDVEELLGDNLIADNVGTDWRNKNVEARSEMWKFINSERGETWKVQSLRDIWGLVKELSEEDAKKSYPGLMALRNANSWEEALNTDITIYRGLPEETERPYIRRNFISYTVVPAMADKFARGYVHSYDAGEGKGLVVKRTIKFNDIFGYVNNDGENEVLVAPPKKGQHVILVGPERVTYERRDKSK